MADNEIGTEGRRDCRCGWILADGSHQVAVQTVSGGEGQDLKHARYSGGGSDEDCAVNKLQIWLSLHRTLALERSLQRLAVVSNQRFHYACPCLALSLDDRSSIPTSVRNPTRSVLSTFALLDLLINIKIYMLIEHVLRFNSMQF